MKHTLSQNELENYVVSNSHYYEKYRKKFNTQGRFVSFNWALFFFGVFWMPYRKMWGYFILYFVINLILVGFSYKVLLEAQSLRVTEAMAWGMIVAGVLLLCFVLYTLLYANYYVLLGASRAKEAGGLEAKSSWMTVLIAALIFLSPNIAFLTKVYGVYQDQEEQKALYLLSKKDSLSYANAVIDRVSDKNLLAKSYYGDDITSKVLCHDNQAILEKLKQRGVIFGSKHLLKAQRCDATTSMHYFLDQGVQDENNLALENALYRDEFDTVKLLLKNVEVLDKEKLELLKEIFYIGDATKKKGYLDYFFSKEFEVNTLLDDNSTSLLKIAVSRNDYNTSKYLLEKGADINLRYRYNLSILSDYANVEILKLLLESGVEVADEVLVYTVQHGEKECLEAFLVHGSEVTQEMLLATIDKYDAKRLALIAKYTKPSFTPQEVQKLYQEACLEENIEALDLLDSWGYKAQKYKESVFKCMLYYSHKDKVFNHLITKSMDVNYVGEESYQKNNLLQSLIRKKEGSYSYYDQPLDAMTLEKMKKLLKHGININYQNEEGITVITQLLGKGKKYFSVVKYLLEHTKIDVSLLTEAQNSLLHYAVADTEILKSILEQMKQEKILKAFIDKQNEEGKTALHYATNYANESVALLLDYGANPKIVDNNTYMPLAYVFQESHYKLLKESANPLSQTRAECLLFVGEQGNKAYQKSCSRIAKTEKDENSKAFFELLAEEFKHFETVEHKYHEACMLDRYKYTALMWLQKKEHQKAAKFLKAYKEHASMNHSMVSDEYHEILMEDMKVFERIFGEGFKKDMERLLNNKGS